MFPVSIGGRNRGRISLIKSGLISTSSLMAFMLLSEGPATAQQTPPPDTQVRPVDVSAPRARPRQTARPATPARRVQRPLPQPAPPAVAPVAPVPIGITGSETPGPGGATGPVTPLNTNVITQSGSRLGLTPRETPATIEVLSQTTIREQSYRTTSEAVQGFTGVTAGNSPGNPANFSMRGFSGTQINTLYNGIKIGPSEMTSRPMSTDNLDRIEILKGPASLLSGEGATGGAINYVSKSPHTGPIVNDAFTSWDSFNGYRAGFGSGGTTAVKGLDYRFDVSGAKNNSFIDDTYSKLFNISGQFNYRVNDEWKVWIAGEHKEDKDRFYWGTPLVAANFPGIVPTRGIVSGLWTQYYPGPGDFDGHVGTLNPVTIDARTLRTTYNVLDNKSGGNENWLRGGWEFSPSNSLTFRGQFYGYQAHRFWFNNEVNAFNDSPNPTLGNPGEVFRERLSVDHQQRLFGTIQDAVWNTNIAGMDNRAALTFAASSLQFNVIQDDFFFEDTVALVNPARGFYGPQQTKPFFTHVDNVSLSFEDRIKITPTFALIGGVRVEDINLSRVAYDVNGNLRVNDGYPFAKTFTPTTGRVGYTWEAVPGLTFYSQYATAADPTVANIFNLRPTQPQLLTESRILETGLKQLLLNNRAEWTFSIYDIERKNVYVPESGQQFNVAGKVHAQGIEFAAAFMPIDGLKVWGNIALVSSHFVDFTFIDGNGVVQSYSGNTPPNVPNIVANAGTSYRFATAWPVEIGAVVRHVGDRFNFSDNLVTMDAYTIADAYAFVDIPGRDITFWQGVDRARIGFRVRNLTDKRYAAWGDPGYTDQIILGAPRSYEVSASFKF